MAAFFVTSTASASNARAPTSARNHPGGEGKCRATQLTPAWNRLSPGEPVSLDIEFQNFKHTSWEKWRHRVGRVAIVNSKGETVLDVYAAYAKEDGVSKLMPPKRFMVTHQDLKFNNGAVPAHKVERWVKQILKGRTVILHGGKHDLSAFVIENDVYADSKVVDMQNEYSHLQFDGTPGLATAAAEVLGESIQEVKHSPVEDAQTALKLWFQNHTYDKDAELAKIEAERANKAKKPRVRTHFNRSAPTRAPAPVVTDASEFPPLRAGKPNR